VLSTGGEAVPSGGLDVAEVEVDGLVAVLRACCHRLAVAVGGERITRQYWELVVGLCGWRCFVFGKSPPPNPSSSARPRCELSGARPPIQCSRQRATPRIPERLEYCIAYAHSFPTHSLPPGATGASRVGHIHWALCGRAPGDRCRPARRAPVVAPSSPRHCGSRVHPPSPGSDHRRQPPPPSLPLTPTL